VEQSETLAEKIGEGGLERKIITSSLLYGKKGEEERTETVNESEKKKGLSERKDKGNGERGGKGRCFSRAGGIPNISSR